MPATTIGPVFDRVNSVVAGVGFTRSTDAFSFDYQPRHKMDMSYYVETALEQSDGYSGMACGELHRIRIWVSRRIKHDVHGAYRQLLTDLGVIEAPLYLDYPNFGYHVGDDSVTKDVPTPGDEWSHVIGKLEFLADIDRQL